MIKFLITILFCFVLTSSIAQNGVNKNDMVGFSCSKGGYSTNQTAKALALLENSEYQEISKMLDSKSDAEKFLAVVFLERLDAENKYSINEEEHNKIKLIKESKRKLSYCAGCRYWETATLKVALADSSDFRRLSDITLKRILKK